VDREGWKEEGRGQRRWGGRGGEGRGLKGEGGGRVMEDRDKGGKWRPGREAGPTCEGSMVA
jgi:hypothetical protein